MLQKYKVALIQAQGNVASNLKSYKVTPSSLSALKTYAETKLKEEVDIRIFDDIRSIIEFSPQMVGIGSYTHPFPHAIDIAEAVRKFTDAVIVIGGYHITFLPEEIMHTCFDIGVLGEGEKTFTEIIKTLAATDNDISPAGLKNIKGIVYKDCANYVVTQKRETLPVDEIPMAIGGKDNRKQSSVESIFTSRGCPYKCKFCSSSAFWGGVRFFTPERVVEEIRWNYEHLQAKFINFEDDLFIYPEERLYKIVELLEKDGLLSKIRFRGHVRANLLNKNVLEALKRLNFDFIVFGPESGSDRILKMYKPGISVEINQRCIDLASSHGFKVYGYFIVGFPEETKEDLLQTAAFINKNINEQSGQVILFQPYPGTEAWDLIDENIRRDIIDHRKWYSLNTWQNHLFANKFFSQAEFEKIIKDYFPKNHLFGEIYDNMFWYVDAMKSVLNDGYGLLLYGAGGFMQQLLDYLPKQARYRTDEWRKFGGILDSNYDNIHPFTDGDIPILPPETALRDMNEKILITSTAFYNDIREKLLKIGVSEQRIIHIPDHILNGYF